MTTSGWFRNNSRRFVLLVLLVLTVWFHYKANRNSFELMGHVVVQEPQNQSRREIEETLETTTLEENFLELHNFSLTLEEEDTVPCRGMRSQPPVEICLYTKAQDQYISGAILDGGVWEGMTTQEILRILSGYADIGYIDIGANIGVHGLVVAKAGYRVLAVEPNHENILRLHKSVKLNHLQDRVTLVKNSVSTDRAYVTLLDIGRGTNRGAFETKLTNESTGIKSIIMDDLIPYIPFEKAVMKIDVELHEPMAMFHSHKLLTQINVTHIIMEWHFSNNQLTDPSNNLYPYLKTMVKNLLELRYFPHRPFSYPEAKLDVTEWDTWPNDVLWIKDWKL